MNKNFKKWLIISIVIIILALGLGLGLGLGLKKKDTRSNFSEFFEASPRDYRTINQTDQKHNGKTILTIFAGRKQFLEILFVYLDKLIKIGQLTEVHLWNYARSKDDKEWLRSLVKKKYKVFEPRNREETQWEEYYKFYYTQNEYDDNDILIKCDDDITFLGIENFNFFINQIDDKHLYFPNIVNNDVCAFIQSMFDVHPLLKHVEKRKLDCGNTEPMTEWYKSYKLAYLSHSHFLQNRAKYSLRTNNILWNSRISINFFGAKIKFIKIIYKLFYERKDKKIGDEPFFAWICKAYNFSHVIVPRFVVTHFSFGSQNNALLESKFLDRYRDLSRIK